MSVQKHRDEPSGLYVSDRFFQPESVPAAHPLLWFAADALLLSCLVSGLLMLFVSGFLIPVHLWFFPVLIVMCTGITALFHSTRCQSHRLVTGVLLLLLYLLVLFLCQDIFLDGMKQFADLAVSALNRTYNGELSALEALSDGSEAEVFLILAAFPVIFWFGVSLFWHNSLLLFYLLLFPLLALLALCGAADNTVALFLVLLGTVLCVAFLKPRRQHRMWGGKNRQLKKENQLRFQSIQKKSTAIMLGAFVILSIPGFFLVRPFLSVSLKPAQQLSMDIQSSFLTRVMKLLPQISAGQWNLRLEAVGGGVQDGAVDSDEGYLLEEVEDLKLTLDTKPKEAIFLKGYIGTTYESGGWENPYGTTFDGAAINWNTEGSSRLYIQNLPFLRTAFALEQRQSEDAQAALAMSAFSVEPAQLLVERTNANDAYTYVPYGAYLNDYYQIDSGDGAVLGQSKQEDRFYFFFREDLEAVLSAWNELEDTENVLDRVEESYRAFCAVNNRSDCPGMDVLQEKVDEVMEENRWSTDENINEITSWIRQYLAENYEYQKKPESVPDGKDALEYFLFESKKGNSVHFGSAAVVLYRMFGIPARYVVGYEVPAALFTAQPNGTYTAVVQGDNAQAFAEIYFPGMGWMPKDMTPGVIGTYEEVGPGGEKIEVYEDADSGKQEEQEEQKEKADPKDEADEKSRPSGFGRRLIQNYSVEQIIWAFIYLVSGILMAAGAAFTVRYFCRTFGYDPFHRYSRQQCLVFVFQALYFRMRRLGLPQSADSQSEEFLVFCEKELNRRCPKAAGMLRPAVEKLYRSCYGEESVSKEDIAEMRSILLASRKPRGRC